MGTVYNTRALAEALDIEGTPKQAGRELRKFLRDITPREEQPGKGGRYSIELNKRELTAMKKKFNAWRAEQEEARKARIEAKKAESDKSVNAIANDAKRGGTSVNAIIEDEPDTEDEPTETDIDDMIRELAEENNEA